MPNCTLRQFIKTFLNSELNLLLSISLMPYLKKYMSNPPLPNIDKNITPVRNTEKLPKTSISKKFDIYKLTRMEETAPIAL
jgi:hypothetical protein